MPHSLTAAADEKKKKKCRKLWGLTHAALVSSLKTKCRSQKFSRTTLTPLFSIYTTLPSITFAQPFTLYTPPICPSLTSLWLDMVE